MGIEQKQSTIERIVKSKIRQRDFILDAAFNYKPIALGAFALHTVTNALVIRFDSSPRVREALDKYQPRDISWSDKLRRELIFFQRSRAFSIGARASNGWRLRLASSDSNYCRYLKRAYTDFKFRDHGHDHERRVKSLIRLIVQNSPEIELSWMPAIDALAGEGSSHDIHQVLTKVWNEETGLDLDEKAGHDFAAAVMDLATFREYAKERGITEEEAWLVQSIKAFYEISHDDSRSLEELDKANIRADSKVYEDDGRPGAPVNPKLIKDLEAGIIDTKTLSAYQAVKIMRHYLAENIEKAREAGQRTTYGLIPDFEQSHPIIGRFLTDDKYKKPLLDNLEPGQIISIHNGRTIFKFADQFDMFTPFVTICRKLTVQKSTKRPFFKHTAGGVVADVDSRIFHESDTHRLFFEIKSVDDVFTGTALENSRFARYIIAEHQIASLLQFKKFGPQLMSGDISVFDELYDERAIALGIKMLRRLDAITDDNFVDTLNTRSRQEQLSKIREIINKYGKDSDIPKRFENIYQELQKEHEGLIASVMKKPENYGNTEIYKYTPAEIEEFEAACDHFIYELFDKYEGLPDLDREALVASVRSGYNPPLGFTTYDSSGNLTDMKTFMTHKESILVKLILRYPQVRRLLSEGKLIVERKRHINLVRTDIFERLGFSYLLDGKSFPKGRSDEVYKRLARLRRAGLEPNLVKIIDDVINTSPNNTPEIETVNRFFTLLGFPIEYQSDFQQYAWREIMSVYPQEQRKRFDDVLDFAAYAYGFHEVRRTKDEFINHPLAVALLDIQNRKRSESDPVFTVQDVEDVEVAVFHDLVEDLGDKFVLVQDENKFWIRNKDDPENSIIISKDQYDILTSLTRIRGRDEEWLNQIISLPIFLRARAAKVKTNEIVHNIYTGRYDTYLDAIRRTEEQERTLIILTVSSVFSLRHPTTNIGDMARLLLGYYSKIITPSVCASYMKDMYYTLIEREFSNRIRNLSTSNEIADRQDKEVAQTIRPIIYEEGVMYDTERELMKRLKSSQNGRLGLAFRGDRKSTDSSPVAILHNFWTRNRIYPNSSSGLGRGNMQWFRPIDYDDLNYFVAHNNLLHGGEIHIPNPYRLGRLNHIWFDNTNSNKNKLNRFYRKHKIGASKFIEE